MITKLLVWIIIIILYYSFIKYMINKIKKAETFYEKVLYGTLILLYGLPSILYLIDSYNLAVKLGFLKNVDGDRWFDFISSYFATIAGCVFSGIVLLLITYWQTTKQDENNRERIRIDNLPLLKYKFEIIDYVQDKNINEVYIPTSCEKGKIIYLKLDIKNIGMNTVRECSVTPSANIISNLNDYKLNSQPLIEKGTLECMSFIMKIPTNQEQKINFKIKYQDVLFNKYEQDVELLIDVLDESSRPSYIMSYKCKNEVLVEKHVINK